MLNIKRASKFPPPHRVKTASGHGYRLHADGKIIPDKPLIRNEDTLTGRQISIQARTMAEARHILEGIQRNYPAVDVEKSLAGAVSSTTYLDEPVKIDFEGFGGELAGRSIVKTAVAMAFSMGMNPQVCDFALHYLNDPAATPALAEFHLRDLVMNRPTSHLFNSVTVAGDASKRRLTAYIEYFGITRWIVHLSQHYAGPFIHKTYAFNPATGRAIHVDIDLNLSDHEYALSLLNDARSDGGYEKAFAYAIPIILKLRNERATESVLNAAIAEAFEAIGIRPGEELAPEQVPAFTACIVKKIMPYLMRTMDSRPRPHDH